MTFVKEFWHLTLQMAPYLLLGFSMAGLLHVLFSPAWIARHLGRAGLRANMWSAFFGVPLPLCSCSVVPTAISLRRSGASRGSTVSFLSATPQISVDSMLVTSSFLGWPLMVYKVVAAFINGVVAGVLTDRLCKNSPEQNIVLAADNRLRSLRAFLHYAYVEMVVALRKWLVLGLLIATAINLFIPADWVSSLSKDSILLPYLLVLLIATPMYICSSASVPIAAALIAKGFPVGVALVFLMAGPATNAATITVLWRALGRKETLIYLVNIILASLMFAFLFDLFFVDYTIPWMNKAGTHAHQHEMPWWSWASAILLFGLIAYSYVEPYLKRKGLNEHAKIALTVKGLNCGKCVSKASAALSQLDFVKAIDLKVSGECQLAVEKLPTDYDQRISKIVKDAGYEAVFNRNT